MALQIVVGGQYGSEAKGHVAGYLARRDRVALAIRVAGPNAGHSVVHPDTGIKYALRQIPVAAVTNPETTLAIGAGSEIDLQVLRDEIELLEGYGIKVRERLVVDPSATILTSDHFAREQASTLVGRLGSTGKGIGAARAERIWRRAGTVAQFEGTWLDGTIGDVAGLAMPKLALGSTVQVEGTQGYGLSLHGPHYPYCTSSDCTAIDFLAMARISPWAVPGMDLQVWVVFRPYPIRVAGNSGPIHQETSWEALGLPPEYTTVTKKMRRVGHWDPLLAIEAIRANGGEFGGMRSAVRVAVTMIDQLDPTLAGCTDYFELVQSETFCQFMAKVTRDTNRPVSLVTTSDRTAVDLQ